MATDLQLLRAPARLTLKVLQLAGSRGRGGAGGANVTSQISESTVQYQCPNTAASSEQLTSAVPAAMFTSLLSGQRSAGQSSSPFEFFRVRWAAFQRNCYDDPVLDPFHPIPFHPAAARTCPLPCSSESQVPELPPRPVTMPNALRTAACRVLLLLPFDGQNSDFWYRCEIRTTSADSDSVSEH